MPFCSRFIVKLTKKNTMRYVFKGTEDKKSEKSGW